MKVSIIHQIVRASVLIWSVQADIGGVFDTKSCVNLKLTLDVHVQCEKKDLCLFTGNGGVSFSAPDFCEPLGMLLPGTMTA